MESPRYRDFLIGPFQIFIRPFCSLSPSLRPPTMPSISVLSSCGLAVARLCDFVSMWLRSFSSLSLLYNGTNALAFVPGAGVRGMKGAQAERCIHSNTHLWQTPGPHDSPRTTACVTKSKSFITDDRVGGIHSLNSHTCIITLCPAGGLHLANWNM